MNISEVTMLKNKEFLLELLKLFAINANDLLDCFYSDSDNQSLIFFFRLICIYYFMTFVTLRSSYEQSFYFYIEVITHCSDFIYFSGLTIHNLDLSEFYNVQTGNTVVFIYIHRMNIKFVSKFCSV